MPTGTRLVATLDDALSTRDARAEDRSTITTRSPSQYEGAVIEGIVSSVNASGRLSGRALQRMDTLCHCADECSRSSVPCLPTWRPDTAGAPRRAGARKSGVFVTGRPRANRLSDSSPATVEESAAAEQQHNEDDDEQCVRVHFLSYALGECSPSLIASTERS